MSISIHILAFVLLFSLYARVTSSFIPTASDHSLLLNHLDNLETTSAIIAAGSTLDLDSILSKAASNGVKGAKAAGVQVVSLMWLRTTLNYQYRYGTSTSEALSTLYKDGGLGRFYQGFPFALVQGPLSRFGDTASNAIALGLVESLDPTGTIPLFVRTGLGSISAALWRIVIMPVDTVKTSFQVNGEGGFKLLKEKMMQEGLVATLYAGGAASAIATAVGHYPWFLVFNALSEGLPTAQEIINMKDTGIDPNSIYAFLSTLDVRLLTLLRSALIGILASSTSDICSNGIRVLKTVRQTSPLEPGSSFSYIDAAREIIDKEGWSGLLGRGLQTRLLSNCIQAALFSVLYKYFQDEGKR